jgi:hypothetical protein
MVQITWKGDKCQPPVVLGGAGGVTSGHPVQFSTADRAEMAARFAWHYDKVQRAANCLVKSLPA